MSRRLAPLLAVSLLLCVAAAEPASAHRAASDHPAPEESISIPNLSHGQMVVIADHRAEIMALAERQIPTDRVMRRLEGFINIEVSACMWGMMPGSLRDESSPFNECTHAYLAATRALLMHLRDMPGDRTAVRALVSRIELEMLVNNAALVLCRFSDEPFNTAEIIHPHWREVPSHPVSLATLLGVALASIGCAGMAARTKTSRSAPV